MKKAIRILLSIFALIILTGTYFLTDFFLIGEVATIDHINLKIKNVSSSEVSFQVDSQWSALALKGFSYTYQDNVLAISFKEVMVSDLYKFGYMDSSIIGDFENLKEIRLTDNQNYSSIWKIE